MQYSKKLKTKNATALAGSRCGGKKVKTEIYEYVLLPVKNVDTGTGLERLASVLQKTKTIFETDLFLPIIKEIEKQSSVLYLNNPRPFRIIADHLRAACFLIAEGILPAKEDRGYVLRRLLRRSIRFGKLLNLPKKSFLSITKVVIENYKQNYPELKNKENDIFAVLENEEEKFLKTLNSGLKEFEKIIEEENISGEQVFYLYETFGFPYELTKELAEEKGIIIDEKKFQESLVKHQEISRSGARKKFGGLGISEIDNQSEKIAKTKLHTATHLLQQALRNVLGEHIHQAGSDITSERLRFDFTHQQKMTDEEKNKVEEIVNRKIKENLTVNMEEMPYEQATKKGALAFFKERYPKIVKVYSIGDYSREICGGPHIDKTGELGVFKIIKEESSAQGIRRIKATLFPRQS